MQDKEIAEFALQCLLDQGADKASCVYTQSEKNEFNLESDHINLLRTTFDDKLTLRAIKNQCLGTLTINKVDRDAIKRAVEDTLVLAASSQPDAAHAIAPRQERREFSHGDETPDLARMLERLTEFQADTRQAYPEVVLDSTIIDHTKSKTYTLNSNGTDLTEEKGYYNIDVVFTAKKNGSSSSSNYESMCLKDLGSPIIQNGMFAALLRQSTEQLSVKQLPGKFVGDVIIVPGAMQEFLYAYLSYLRDYYLISKSSVFQGKLNEKIAHESFTLASNPVDAAITHKSYVTRDAYLAQNINIIEQGVLKTYLVSLYGANKTDLSNPPNDAEHLCVQPGSISMDEMIRSINRGLLLTRYSGDSPGGNGDFSGVAKNSYYIENGRILFPVQEVMVSGNLVEGFSSIVNISSEWYDNGYSLIPWVQVKGWTISGS